MSSTATITREKTLDLRGYGGTIQDVKSLTSFSADTPVEELRARFKEDGVLWIKGLINRDTVKKFRGDYLSFVNQGSKMLKPKTDPVEGVFSGNDWRNYVLPGAVRLAMGLEDEGPFVENSVKSHVAPWYITFKDEVGTGMESFVGKLFEFEGSWCLPRSLLRSSVPGAKGTPVHYDLIYLRAGPPTSVTTWVTVGDIETKGGGLVYLQKSHEIGKKYKKDFSNLSEDLSGEEKISTVNRNMNKGGWLDRDSTQFGKNWGRSWLVGEYEVGDVVFHHPHPIHASAINESEKGHIRVSTDLRFVDKSKPLMSVGRLPPSVTRIPVWPGSCQRRWVKMRDGTVPLSKHTLHKISSIARGFSKNTL